MERKASLLIACIAATCFANVPLWLLPEILSDSMEALNLSAFQASALVSAEAFMMAFASIALATKNFRFTYRTLGLIGAAIGLAGNFSSFAADSFLTLFVSRAIAGIGEGAVLMVANTLVADFDKPDKAYANMNTVNIIYGSAAFFSLPFMFPHRDGLTIFLIVAVAMLPLTPMLFWLSRRKVERTSHAIDANTKSVAVPIMSLPSVVLYAGMLFIGTGCGASWSFLVEFGKQIQLPQDQIDVAISVATVSAIAGSALVSIVGVRFGRFKPMALAIIMLGYANYDLSHTQIANMFRIDAVALLVGMYFLLPLFLGYGAEIDKSGRISAIVCAIFMVTSGSIGPLMGGVITDYFELSSVGTAILALCVLSLILLSVLARLLLTQHRRVHVVH